MSLVVHGLCADVRTVLLHLLGGFVRDRPTVYTWILLVCSVGERNRAESLTPRLSIGTVSTRVQNCWKR